MAFGHLAARDVAAGSRTGTFATSANP
jgi:hypothetical protein